MTIEIEEKRVYLDFYCSYDVFNKDISSLQMQAQNLFNKTNSQKNTNIEYSNNLF